ncbi:TPA: hypothetical protein ACSB37_003875, partial [Acinetobacter baumannii]
MIGSIGPIFLVVMHPDSNDPKRVTLDNKIIFFTIISLLYFEMITGTKLTDEGTVIPNNSCLG